MCAGTVVEPPGAASAAIGDFDIEVGGLERKLGAVAVQKHVSEDRNRIAALDHAMDMAQGLQQFRTLNGDFHRQIRKEAETRTIRVARREAFGKPAPAAPRGFSMSF
jgi:sialic acid synthase SpsE